MLFVDLHVWCFALRGGLVQRYSILIKFVCNVEVNRGGGVTVFPRQKYGVGIAGCKRRGRNASLL